MSKDGQSGNRMHSSRSTVDYTYVPPSPPAPPNTSPLPAEDYLQEIADRYTLLNPEVVQTTRPVKKQAPVEHLPADFSVYPPQFNLAEIAELVAEKVAAAIIKELLGR